MNDEGSASSAAVVISNSLLTCETPEWGSQYGEGTVLLQIEELQNGTYSPIAFTNGSFAITNVSSSTCTYGTCLFDFVAVWRSFHPTIASALGGTSVQVWGSGFVAQDLKYVAVFSTGMEHLEASDETSAVRLNSVSFLFSTPQWMFAAGPTNFSIQNMSQSVYSVSNGIFEFVTAWSSKNVSETLAKGGAPILVQGAGFIASREYVCVFARYDWSQQTAMRVLSQAEGVCNSPVWLVGYGTANFSIKTGNDTVLFDGNSGEDEITLLESWTGINTTVQLSGSAAGGDVLTIVGSGFDLNASYSCAFLQGPGRQVLSPATVLTSLTLRCQTAAWGQFYAAGNVSLNIIRGNGVGIPFADDQGSAQSTTDCASTRFRAQCSFRFETVWEPGSMDPTELAATAGQAVEIAGFGFSDNTSYACVFTVYGLNASVEYNVTSGSYVDSASSLVCFSPDWDFRPASNVTVHIENEEGLLDVTSLTPPYVTFVDVYFSISPASGSAKGGDTVAISGNGFDRNESYICDFGPGSSAATFISTRMLTCITPRLFQASDRFDIQIKTSSGRVVSLRTKSLSGDFFVLPASSVPLGFGYFPEWLQHSEIADRLGMVDALSFGITLKGYGFNTNLQYSCRIVVDVVPAFSADSDLTFAVDSETVICPTPQSDLTTMWSAFSERIANLSLWEAGPGAGSALVFSSNGTTAPGQVPLRIVQINRRPGFLPSEIELPTSKTNKIYTFPDWATDIFPGIAQDLTSIPTEGSQSVTFSAQVLSGTLLDGTPTITHAGILTFEVKAGHYGVANVQVILSDDAGLEFGGDDVSTRAVFKISVLPPRTTPSLSFDEVLAVPEIVLLADAYRFMFGDFLQIVNTSGTGDLDSLLEIVNVVTTSNVQYFSFSPQISNAGVLTFETEEG
eukprot:3372462-Rhodomonas_salina.1